MGEIVKICITVNLDQSSCSKQAPKAEGILNLTHGGTRSPGTESNPNINKVPKICDLTAEGTGKAQTDNTSNVIHGGTESKPNLTDGGDKSAPNLTDGGDQRAKILKLAAEGTNKAQTGSNHNLADKEVVNMRQSILKINNEGTSSAQTNNTNVTDGGTSSALKEKFLNLINGLNSPAKLENEIKNGNGNSSFEIEIKLYPEDNSSVKKFKEQCKLYEGLKLAKSNDGRRLECDGGKKVEMFSIGSPSDSNRSYSIFDRANSPFGNVTTATTATLEQLFKHPDTSFQITSCTVSSN